jgi:hypothetical protein
MEYLPTDVNPSILSIDEIFRILKKKKQVDGVEAFDGNFIDGITRGFKPGSLYSDMTPSPEKSSMESPPMKYSHR